MRISVQCYARPRMDAAVWTAIGLLAATSLGNLFYLGARIDGLAARIEALGGCIDGIGGRVDGVGGRIDSLAARIDSRFDSLEARLDAHLDRHAG